MQGVKVKLRTSIFKIAAILIFLSPMTQAEDNDPYLWLEEIESERALNWARERNKESLAVFEADPRYEIFRKKAEDLLQAQDKIPYGSLRRGHVYNFWQDKNHVKGLWRRATLEEYRKKNTTWDILLDVDALAADEKESWVYKGSQCLPPQYEKCMIRLSRGGKDASVYREFDVKTKAFVEGGFLLAEAKSDVAWLDENTLFVATDFGTGTLTQSGYPRVVKRWQRGAPLTQAVAVFEGQENDVAAWSWVSHRPEGKFIFLGRSLTFYESEYWQLKSDGGKEKMPWPKDADLKGIFQGDAILWLRSPWSVGQETFGSGALVAVALEEPRNQLKARLIFAPDERSSIQAATLIKTAVLVSLLKNVRSEIWALSKKTDGSWSRQKWPFPGDGYIEISSAEETEDDVFVSYEYFLTPDRVYWHGPGPNKPEMIKSLPPRFDAKPYRAEQWQATSKDGTKIPYFIIHAKNWKQDGGNPTLLYGYGGFENSETPFYLMTPGNFWLNQGGVYVDANIRGGGEFGPQWHQAAIKENRQRAYDDFIAVAEDLIKRQVTTAPHLGIMGGSNGGLLMGVMLTQRPDLFNAVVAQVPLLDMLRYSKLLAGASWVAEYGDPDIPQERLTLEKYSPYHNLRSNVTYPKAFIHTSTKDDRVHPGHARKMAAKMRALEIPVYYYENIEGGHSAAADLLQRAKRYAMEYVYLLQQLKDGTASDKN
ncbi:MAG: S9 family peptidase [Elusimicrobia bacterium]|nr:S9 family peptidase [Elusimicrobiota bacterium]